MATLIERVAFFIEKEEKMKKIFRSLAVSVFVSLISSQTFAAVIQSKFTHDDEGWAVSPTEGVITYQNTGGNPGGYLSIDDIGDGTYVAYAPSKYLGDLSVFDGGMISYDVRVLSSETSYPPNIPVDSGFGRINICGSDGGCLTFDYVNPSAFTAFYPTSEAWTTYYAPLQIEYWQAGQEGYDRILSDASYIDIILGHGDVVGFDNFKIQSGPGRSPVPEPSTLLLLGVGLSGLGLLRRRKG